MIKDKRKAKLLILGWKADKHIGFFSDLYARDDVIVHFVEPNPVVAPLKILRKIYTSSRIYRLGIKLPWRYKWYNYGQNLDLKGVSTILAINGVLDKVNYAFLHQCKKQGIEVDLFLLDSIDASSLILKGNRHYVFSSIWDHVYSFDKRDVEKYGFEYLGFCYYSIDKEVRIPIKIEYDLYFSGNTKGGRYDMIHRIFNYLSKKDVKLNFQVQLQSNKESKIQGIHYLNHWVPYHDVLLGVANSKCILEIVQKNQTGPSLRYFEAVCFNKKLLTNNPSIINFPYYNAKWMKIIQLADEIDVDWLTREEIVDYHYKGEFSPNKLVDFFKSRGMYIIR